jgi:hypothetical protein
MGAATLALACLWLATGQVPGDVHYTNQRAHRIPVNIPEARRGEIARLVLYASADQGRNWHQAAIITPDKDAFIFTAPADGAYWFRVAVVNRQNQQDPENIAAGPPDQRMVIDSTRPVVRYLTAQRQGETVTVSWEVQDEHPDPASFRLEFQPKDSVSPLWTAIAAPQAGLSGQTSFLPGSRLPLSVRVTFRDLAGNQSFALADVPGDGVTPATFANNAAPAVEVSKTQTPVSELTREVPVPAPMNLAGQAPTIPIPTKIAPESMTQETRVNSAPPMKEPIQQTTAQVPTPKVAPEPTPTPPVEKKVVADTRWLPPAEPAADKQVGRAALVPGAVLPDQDPGSVAGAAGNRKLPPLHYVNQPEVTLEYELSRIGPSGIGSVDLWWTQNDGQTWELYAVDEKIRGATAGGRHQRTVELPPGDAVYGFILVVKSRAGLGRTPPRAGDLPEIRVEVDTKPPAARLFEPVPDPNEDGHLLFMWEVEDKNLTKTPVCLEWAEQRDGPWQPIGLDLPSAPSKYSWKLPEKMPVQVYLRLRVRDLAGNESVAVSTPQLVDLSEPEGHLINVSAHQRRP